MATRCFSPPDSFVGQEVGAVTESNPLECRQRTRTSTAVRLLAVHLGQHHVFQHRTVGQQVE